MTRDHWILSLACAGLLMACSSDSNNGETDDDTPDTAEDAEDAENDATVETGGDPGVDVGPPGVGPTEIPDGAELVELGPETECGTPVEIAGTGLRRAPYIQSVFSDSARVAWTTTVGSSAMLRVGEPGSMDYCEEEASPRVFEVEETNDTEAYTAFDATVSGLEPGTLYCYEILVDDELVVARGSFTTAWTTHDRPVSMVVVGDSGNASPEQIALSDMMLGLQPDIFIHAGDMAYSDGTFVEFEERVFGIYEAMMQSIPMWPTPGNHEYRTPLAQPYIDVYYLPEQAYREEDQEYYYSFDYGNVHFISLDSNEFRYITTISGPDDDMIDWLEDDLANTDADWIVAFMHHPVYSSGSHGNTMWLHDIIVPVLEEGGVDLVLVGHDHHYERTRAILENEVAEDDPYAITYIVSGAGGAGLREAPGDWWTAAVNDTSHSILYFEIDGCTGTGTALDAEGNELDTFTLDGCE